VNLAWSRIGVFLAGEAVTGSGGAIGCGVNLAGA